MGFHDDKRRFIPIDSSSSTATKTHLKHRALTGRTGDASTIALLLSTTADREPAVRAAALYSLVLIDCAAAGRDDPHWRPAHAEVS
jgi:hypothetical protein